jgi:hypothetical protein
MPDRATAQIAAIIAAGFTPGDAARWVREAQAAVPEGADPRTWLPDPGTFAMSAVIDEVAVQDARADWYVVAPLEYKLLLDDLGPPQEAVGLGEAIFYNPYHEPAGTSVGGRFAHAEGTGAILRNGEGWYETEDVNAVPLYHRTTATALASIQREGLRSAQNTMYGEGIYFTNEAPQKSGARDAYVQATLHPHRQLVVERDIDVERIYREVADTRPWHSDSAEKLRAAGYGSVRLISSEGDWIWTLVIDPALIKLSPGVMLAEAKFGGPGSGNYGHAGRPGVGVGGSAPSRYATIGPDHQIIYDGEEAPQLGGPVADHAWVNDNIKISGSGMTHLGDADTLAWTIGSSKIPIRYLEGVQFSTDPPHGYRLAGNGSFLDPVDPLPNINGLYVPSTDTIHIAPASVDASDTVIHEVGHHVMYRQHDAREMRSLLNDKFDYRSMDIPRPLESGGLRNYSISNARELYADAFVVALRGSPSQQAALRKWLDMDWEALFIELGGPGSGNYGHAGRPGVGVGGSGPGLSFAPTAERVWTGKRQPAAGDLSKETTGALGEALAAHVLSQRFGARFETLNQGLNNAPLDVAGDHVAVEVKTGLASNGASAQHWRATIGEPGREEKAAMRGLTAAEKAEYNQIKQELVMERKTDMLREMSAVSGGDVQGFTLGVILAPDGRRGDAWLIPGFHARIGWNQLARTYQDAYVGTWTIDREAQP